MGTSGAAETEESRGNDLMSSRRDRRAWLRRMAGAALAVGAGRARISEVLARADEPGAVSMIVRSRRPIDLETPVQALDSWRTPNDAFFVRSHLGEPAVTAPWTIEVGGMVASALGLGLRDLRAFEPVTIAAVLQCSGNGRGFFRPRVPGLGWDRGAVGNAEWSGVRLADVIAKAGLQNGAKHVHLLGADGPPTPKTPPYLRSIPLEKRLHPATILATSMNDVPLPLMHGGPVRLVVPGWTGNHWMKWVRSITVSADEAPGFYMQTGYRMPKASAPTDLVPLTTLNVKSLITWPLAGSRFTAASQEIRGVAWTGEGVVNRVEVSVVSPGRAPSWRRAEFLDPPRVGTWRRWRIAWVGNAPSSGKVILSARATDSTGATQPETTPWNKSGYLWNGIDQVTCEAGA